MKVKRLIVTILIGLAMTSCSDDSTEKQVPVGYCISAENLQSLGMVTIDHFAEGYSQVTAANPGLGQDDPQLACQLYDWLKNNPETEGRTSNIFCDAVKKFPLTGAEMLYLLQHLSHFSIIYSTVGPAWDHSAEKYPCDGTEQGFIPFNDNKADAVRHAYWMALLTKRIGATLAAEYGIAHEAGCDNEGDRKVMDLHNNNVGINIAVANPTATDEQLLHLVITSNFVYFNTMPPAIPAQYEKDLVYFRLKREYDLEMTGTMTNPDGGLNWDVDIHFNQCGSAIRGNFIITSGQYYQKRRFSGSLNGGTMNLQVSNPYDFENAPGMQSCTNFQMTLNGNTASMSGNWTATNCSQGGVVNLSAD